MESCILDNLCFIFDKIFDICNVKHITLSKTILLGILTYEQWAQKI